MRPIIEGFSDFAGTKKSYCQGQGIHLHTFDYWLKKFRQTPASQPSTGFVALELEPPGDSPAMELHFSNGNRLRLPADVPLALLQALIKTAC